MLAIRNEFIWKAGGNQIIDGDNIMKRTFEILILSAMFLFVMAGCGGSGGGGGTAATTTNNPPVVQPPAQTLPKLGGFDFKIQKGDYWEYGWDSAHSYFASSGSNQSGQKSFFRITLGDPVTIGDVSYYEMMLSGNPSTTAKPIGKYIGISKYQLITLGSDKTTQIVIFDAWLNKWYGSGFFTSFPSNKLFQGTLSIIKNDYINQSAYEVRVSAQSSQCEYFPGVGNVCGGNYNENLDEREYYIAAVGPAGMYKHSSISDPSSSDGGWWASDTTHIGLVSSSLRGDAVDYQLEVEPNNKIAEATPISIPAKIKGDDANEEILGGTTIVSTGGTSVIEVEANNTPSAPQTITIPSVISGNILEGDAGTSVSGLQTGSGGTYTATFEDWYKFTLPTGKHVNAVLDFAGSGSDLDMYLFSYDGVSTLTTHANSISDNIKSGIYSETINKSLLAGSYYFAIDASSTPSRANYKLTLSTFDSYIKVGDWFSFTLASQSQVTIKVAGGASFVLMDIAGSNTLASGSSSGISINLAAGSYLIGVGDIGSYTLDVTSP